MRFGGKIRDAVRQYRAGSSDLTMSGLTRGLYEGFILYLDRRITSEHFHWQGTQRLPVILQWKKKYRCLLL